MISIEKFLEMQNRYYKFNTIYLCCVDEIMINWDLSVHMTKHLLQTRKYFLDSSYANEFFKFSDNRLQKLHERLKNDLL